MGLGRTLGSGCAAGMGFLTFKMFLIDPHFSHVKECDSLASDFLVSELLST
jgi:hypothetical protein